MTRYPLIIIVTGFACLIGCQTVDDGLSGHRAGSATTLALTVDSSLEDASGDSVDEVVFADDGGLHFELDEAWLVVRHIELYLPAGVRCAAIVDELSVGARCESVDDHDRRSGDSDGRLSDDSARSDDDDTPHSEDDDKILVEGPFVVDLLSATATPDLAAIQVPALPYRRVDIRVDDAVEGGPLDGRSLLVSAAFEHLELPAELTLALSFSEDIRVEAAGGVAVGPALTIEFDAARWLEGIRLGDCLNDGDIFILDGRLVIDDDLSGGCSDVESQFRDNLERSGRLLSLR